MFVTATISGQYVDKFLFWHKKFEPVQNILGPVKGQGMSINLECMFSDVESQEDARLCNFWEDVCYGKLTIAEVNVTLSHGSIMDLIEIKIQKGKEHLLI